jgi:signal transduction histidine kinase
VPGAAPGPDPAPIPAPRGAGRGWLRRALRPLADWRTPVQVGYLLSSLPVALLTSYLLLYALPLSLLFAVLTIVLPLVPLTAIRIVAVILDGAARLILRNRIFSPDRPLPPGRALARLRARAADPAAWLTLVLPLAWAMAAVERALARWLGRADFPTPYRPPTAPTISGRYRDRAAQPATWRDLAYVVLAIPVSLLGVAAVYLAVIAPLILTTTLFWYAIDADDAMEISSAIGMTADTPLESLLVSVIGVLALAVLIHPLRMIARARARLAQALLGPNPHAELARRLATQVGEQRQKRVAAVQVADDEQRRIERDLHDGAQQRLVALALDLSRARRKFGTDPEQAYALVEHAQQEAMRAITELRDLARGIRPPILSDRGLDAAISALAGRASVPVEVDVRLPQRPPAPVESAAYYVVAEALTNVDKHARAERASVWIARAEDCLVVEIRDNGRGGAAPAGRSGLSGLADRVASLDGSLRITSPAGGPTIIHAELPCES